MSTSKTSRGILRVGAGTVMIAILGGSATPAQQKPATFTQQSPGAGAQQTPSTPVQARQAEPVEQWQGAPQPPKPAEPLHLLAGRSHVITSAFRVRRVSLADPTVIDAVVMNPQQVVINAKLPGGSSLIIWDESGQSQTFDVSVDLDVSGLAQQARAVMPDEPVKVRSTKDVITLSGRVSSQAAADRLVQMAQAIAPKKENVVSLLEVPLAPGGEVLLQVKFADVDRTVLKQFGINFLSLPGAKNIGTVSTEQFNPPQIQGQSLTATSGGYTLSDLLNIFIFRPDINLGATIKALQDNNLIEILAEPNVLSETGKEASFLAGGEFPYPVLQPSGGAAAITIQFREFGVKLNFTPVISPDEMIHLKVRPEVSSLDYSNALTISGFTVPALDTRRVESEMILKDGQSFAIAGLVNDQVTQQLSKIPGAGDIPILGKLFQSRNTSKSKEELLVMVTPRIVRPGMTPPAQSEPTLPEPVLPRATAPQHKTAAGGR